MAQVKNDNIIPRTPKPIDERSGLGFVNGVWKTFTSVAQALADPDVINYRYESMTLPINDGVNPMVEYWFSGGILDSNFIVKTPDLTGYVPYENATNDVILGSHNITAGSFIKIAGTVSQFLKADGSVDSTAYATQSSLSGYQLLTQKNQANGYAGLDSGAKILLSQLPDSILGALIYQGTWNAATNTPTLANPPASSTKGNFYVTDTPGTQFGLTFAMGDWIVSNGTEWQKVDNTDAVVSVFGRIGNVLANEGDYSAFYPLKNGTGASGDWPINIIGDATTWEGQKYNTTELFTTPYYVLGYDLATTTWKPTKADGLKNFLGLGTLAYFNDGQLISSPTTGNAATVTNGVYTTGSYANPSWLASLPYTKITGTPNLSGYELLANKQNSLAVDGTGVKYPTVDAMNGILDTKANLLGGNIMTGIQQSDEFRVRIAEAGAYDLAKFNVLLNNAPTPQSVGRLVLGVANYDGSGSYISGTIRPSYSGTFSYVLPSADGTFALKSEIPYGYKTPQEYGAVGDGVADDTTAINNCLNENLNVMLFGTYKITAPINLRTGTYLIGSAKILTQSTTSAILINNQDNVSIQGKITIQGTGNVAGVRSGVNIIGGIDIKVDGLYVSNISGYGVLISKGTNNNDYGNRGRVLISNCYVVNNYRGLYVDYGAEYISITNLNAIDDNGVGVTILAGNISLIGGNVVDNVNGLYIGDTTGSNNSHGIISAVNINHNLGYNARLVNATTGQTFSGCHFYGTASQNIEIVDSVGVNFTSCIIGGLIQNTDANTPKGFHYFSGCQMNDITTASGETTRLYFDNCYTMTGGLWTNNSNDFLVVKSFTVNQADPKISIIKPGLTQWNLVTTGNSLGFVNSSATATNTLTLTNGTGLAVVGGVQTTAGTAALPIYSFTSDPNTGMYNIGADQLGFSTGGVNRLTASTTDIISTLPITATQLKLSSLNTAPASATATGTTGEIRWTSTYIYLCTAANTWVRAALTTW